MPAKSRKPKGKTSPATTFVPGTRCSHITEWEMPDGTRETRSAVETWGSDPRFGVCRQCREVVAREDVALRARRTFTPTKRKAPKPDPLAVWTELLAQAEGGAQ